MKSLVIRSLPDAQDFGLIAAWHSASHVWGHKTAYSNRSWCSFPNESNWWKNFLNRASSSNKKYLPSLNIKIYLSILVWIIGLPKIWSRMHLEYWFRFLTWKGLALVSEMSPPAILAYRESHSLPSHKSVALSTTGSRTNTKHFNIFYWILSTNIRSFGWPNC